MKKLKVNGVFMTSQAVADLFEIKRDTLLDRLRFGWKIEKGHLIAGKRKQRAKCWRRDDPITAHEARMLRESFIGDAEIAENIYC